MKDPGESSVNYGENNFKPPDRCEDNYYEFYSKYQNQGGKGLPPPLENQPFLIDRSYGEEDEHLNSLPNPNQHTSSHQQQIQQLQQQIQQHQQQLQQQQALQMQLQQQQQVYMQQQQQINHSPHLPPPHHNVAHSHQQQQQQQHIPHSQHQHPQYNQHMHQQQHPQSLQQQYLQQQLHQPIQQIHVQSHRHNSVPDARYPLARSTSNPSYPHMRNFEPVQEESQDDLSGSGTIWTPHPRGMVHGLDDYLNPSDDGMQHKGQQQGRHPHMPPHRTPPLPQTHSNNYDSDFDSAYRSAAAVIGHDDIARNIWNDRAFDTRSQQMAQGQHKQHSPHITAPTPTVPSSHAAIMEQLMNGMFPQAPTADSMMRGNNAAIRRRSHSGGVVSIPPPPTTSPPLLNSHGGGSASTSPALPVCRYYAQGFCSRGERCNFIHDEQSQTLANLQQNAGNDQFNIPKQSKGKPKTVASPPPMSMNLPPKVPSPVNNSLRLSQVGNGHHGNGMGNGLGNGNGNNSTLNNLIAGLGNLSMADQRGDRVNRSHSPSNGNSILGLADIIGGGSTSPQPIPRSSSANALADVFANGGSTSPNGKSDLTRQYTSIEQVIGHIYSLCKDQHGCRFLQKKLEDRDSMIVEIIFNEVYDHMTELMIDPFGNYLCQKLLEHCNDDQRLDIIEKVAPDLVKISKNMHGTRAVQKMIEYLTTPEQIAIAKKALSNHVVTLIQDLNGNHVIQRCLNRLSPQDNQFIYDSVSQAGHCVEVATHRHGCCVLQRCIDHASDSQKIQLINEIIANALVLVQDPYGNYVVQYVLDLPFPGLASRLARRFLGHIPILSTQKFSSNVVEKCLNVTDIQTRAAIIQELVEYDNLLYLLQDPYANYVIQTSLNVSEPVQHARLVEAIRPHLTSLRNTPYGKRIQNKILKESSRDYYATTEMAVPFFRIPH